MPDVVIVRHAIAEERDPTRWPDDSRRPLTAFGRERFALAARGLGTLVERPERVLASPYVRTWQTAEILCDETGWPGPEAAPALAAHEPVRSAVALVEALEPRGTTVLVGHEPTTTLLAHALLRPADAEDVMWFKKGAAACVRFTGSVEPGRGRLVWMHQPKALRGLART